MTYGRTNYGTHGQTDILSTRFAYHCAVKIAGEPVECLTRHQILEQTVTEKRQTGERTVVSQNTDDNMAGTVLVPMS